MKNSELLNWLQEEHTKWQIYLDQIGPTRMEQTGVNGDWSMKDIVAHLTGWNRWLVNRIQAAGRGEPEPLPPWPAQIQTEDEINAWIYESKRGRSLREILDESHQDFQQLLAVIKGLPEELRVEQIPRGNRVFHLLWLGEEPFPVGEFFDHFWDDHEPDIRAWIARMETQ